MAKRPEPTDDEVGTIEEQEQRVKLLRAAQASAFKDRSWQAVAMLDIRIDDARRHLRRAATAYSRTGQEQTPTEILAELLALIRDTSQGFPDDAVEAIYVASCERMGISVLREVG